MERSKSKPKGASVNQPAPKIEQSSLTRHFTSRSSEPTKGEIVDEKAEAPTQVPDPSKKTAQNTGENTVVAVPKPLGAAAGKQERFTRLGREFFREEVVALSRKLLGTIIRRNINGTILRSRIVETEAYKAPEDKACHAYKGKTERTKAFWCDAGCWYVYTIYMPTNLCLNIVAAEKDVPEAVLIRAAEPIEGIGEMQKLRKREGKNKPAELVQLTNGPGKLGQAMGFTLAHSTHDFCVPEYEEAYVELDNEYTLKEEDVVISKRINIDYAQEYVDKPWRFYIKNNRYVSVK